MWCTRCFWTFNARPPSIVLAEFVWVVLTYIKQIVLCIYYPVFEIRTIQYSNSLATHERIEQFKVCPEIYFYKNKNNYFYGNSRFKIKSVLKCITRIKTNIFTAIRLLDRTKAIWTVWKRLKEAKNGLPKESNTYCKTLFLTSR